MESDHHHERCPICKQRFLGYTDADMIVHFMENHPKYGTAVATKLGMPKKKVETCDDCGNEYITHAGECPWCRNGGPPFK